MTTTSTLEQWFQATNGMLQAHSNYIQAIRNTQTASYQLIMSTVSHPWMELMSLLEKQKFQVEQGGKSREAKAASTSSPKSQAGTIVAAQGSNSEGPASI